MAANTDPPLIDYDAYRDTIGTVDETGKRRWIFPKKPSGNLHNKRVVVSIILLALMFVGPFLRWKGDPMFLFNILERKFIIFGVPFWPQDFHLLALAIITFFVFIILFTAILGRVWCGWACPQTIFMEMVFRKIEYWIEGDAPKQRKLSRQAWNTEKIIKRGGKWSIFAFISFLIANLVMAYIIGTNELVKLVTEGPFEHVGKFSFVIIFTGIFYFVFTYFREQVCLVICPYGRLQSALLDRESIVVHYDHVRGETRSRIKKGQDRSNMGDCIDCHQCVAVCPTGIDIRNGTQMECVNCTACIDACDEIMDKVEKPRGLIRFASSNMIEEKKGFKFTTRIIAYAVVLVVLSTVLVTSLAMRSSIEATVLRARGTLYSLSEDKQMVTNMYQIQIANKTHDNFEDIEVRLMYPAKGTAKIIGKSLNITDGELGTSSLLVEIPRGTLEGLKTPIKLGFFSGGEELDIVKTKFMGPGK